MTPEDRPSWALLTNHGAVLIYVSMHPSATIREIAADLQLTERRISAIILDLRTEGLIGVTRCGRRNVYTLNEEVSLRQPFMKHVAVSAFVRLVSEALPLAFTLGLAGSLPALAS